MHASTRKLDKAKLKACSDSDYGRTADCHLTGLNARLPSTGRTSSTYLLLWRLPNTDNARQTKTGKLAFHAVHADRITDKQPTTKPASCWRPSNAHNTVETDSLATSSHSGKPSLRIIKHGYALYIFCSFQPKSLRQTKLNSLARQTEHAKKLNCSTPASLRSRKAVQINRPTGMKERSY